MIGRLLHKRAKKERKSQSHPLVDKIYIAIIFYDERVDGSGGGGGGGLTNGAEEPFIMHRLVEHAPRSFALPKRKRRRATYFLLPNGTECTSRIGTLLSGAEAK